MEETRSDLKSIHPYLPLLLRSSTLLFWPSKVVQALKILSKGPSESNVDSGEVFFLAITDLRDSLGLSSHHLADLASDGYTLFFDELMRCVESKKWFEVIVPGLASLLLRLPDLLHAHYQNADKLEAAEDGEFRGVSTGLRLLDSQEAGIVFLSQELIGALLACSMFCLFPTISRDEKCLPIINFDYLFASLCPSYSQNQENKIMCLIHYFERICSCMPLGFVSFERRVLPESDSCLSVSYPKPNFWRRSKVALCCFEVRHSGLIEDQLNEALEVDFANRYLGGGALSRGCVQEEIRFMINPESIVGMLFLPSMEDNEAIEIVGAERFSSYTGYASTFRFAGDYLDKKPIDCTGRRKTWIVAIDALCNAKRRQYAVEYLLREINKAFCGFLDQSKYHCYQKLFQDDGQAHGSNAHAEISEELNKSPSTAARCNEDPMDWTQTSPHEINSKNLDGRDNIGIVTGNWGCGAFGGDPELKSVIQWLAASQALRPFIFYHTFQDDSLQYLEKVSNWILSHKWTVGDLWNMLVEYSSQRIKGETHTGFFSWLLPSLT
ncbi:poly(ADP-ribose) glycohydrolase [Ranunculus cassubicifolius]